MNILTESKTPIGRYFLSPVKRHSSLHGRGWREGELPNINFSLFVESIEMEGKDEFWVPLSTGFPEYPSLYLRFVSVEKCKGSRYPREECIAIDPFADGDKKRQRAFTCGSRYFQLVQAVQLENEYQCERVPAGFLNPSLLWQRLRSFLTRIFEREGVRFVPRPPQAEK